MDEPFLSPPMADEHKNLIFNRSNSAPSFSLPAGEASPDPLHLFSPRTPNPLNMAKVFIFLIGYVILSGIFIYPITGSLKGTHTHKLVDALYFLVVGLCGIGYGDLAPNTTLTKLLTCLNILLGLGLMGILISSLVSIVCDKQQEKSLLSSLEEDKVEGIMKLGFALCCIAGCILIGTVTVHFLEGWSWIDGFYMSVTSVTMVGYGDYAFRTVMGRCFAVVWIPVSIMSVVAAFLYLTQLRNQKNHRIAKWALHREMTVADWIAADVDNDGSVSEAEFVIYKLKEMGMIAASDISQICKLFDSIDSNGRGRITLADLTRVSV